MWHRPFAKPSIQQDVALKFVFPAIVEIFVAWLLVRIDDAVNSRKRCLKDERWSYHPPSNAMPVALYYAAILTPHRSSDGRGARGDFDGRSEALRRPRATIPGSRAG